MRNLQELLSPDSAWPTVTAWIAAARVSVDVLPASEPARSDVLLALQVTTRSPLGAVAFETGGLRIDSGWVRVLGSGSAALPRAVPSWTQRVQANNGPGLDGMLLVADDVLGGLFALNGGAFAGRLGDVHYFAPDTLAWESLDRGYSDFLAWLLQADLARFYDGQRWPGWEAEVASLATDHALSIYPPLWAQGPSVAQRSRKPVPLDELVALQFEMARRIGGGSGEGGEG